MSTAVEAVVGFVDCINRGDVDGLGALMAEDHALQVLDEAPLVGKVANIDAWRGYASAYPVYRIFVHEMTERDGRVAVLGHTTGSHLGLPDEEEREITVIWIATVDGGRLTSWTIADDTPEGRRALGLDPSA